MVLYQVLQVLALHHSRGFSSFPLWCPSSLTLETQHASLLFPLLPSPSSCCSCNSWKHPCFSPGRGMEDCLYSSDRCLFHGCTLDEPSCSPTSADTISGSPLPFLSCLALSWIHWKRALISLHPPERRDNVPQLPPQHCPFWHPPPLLAVAFLCAIRCSSKHRISFVCSNMLMTSQSILSYSFIRNWENACYLLRPSYCRWWVCLFSM